ncbi:hypothetical protein KP509_03G012100 [Ceratopteris richardii]|nr:hypothetical protein KP509_03G012100 [Ceratopteris richardii]
MFPCSTRRSVTASKTMRSTLELLNESDELSSSNDSTCKVKPYNGGRGALRSLMNKVLCNGTPESGSSTSSIGEPDLILGDGGWTPGARVSTHQDESATNQTLSMYEIECMYNNGAENFAHLAEEKGYGDAIKRDCFPAMEDHDVEEVVHETVSMSNDEPVSSSFLFDDSCLSSSSSVSSMNHVMKLESLHPWLTSSADLNSCSSSPHDHKPVNRVLRNVMHNDIQYRLANKRMNLSR